MATRWKARIPGWAGAMIGVVSLAVAVGILAEVADTDALGRSLAAMRADPLRVVLALAAFGVAFGLRAGIWVRVLPDLPFRHALAALHVTLGANHVLPLRLGEPMRIASVVRRTRSSFEAVTASSVALRSADILAMGVLGLVLGPVAFGTLLGVWGAVVLAVVGAIGLAGLLWLRRTRARVSDRIRMPGPVVALGSITAWLLEAVLVWESARFAGIDLSFHHAVLVTTAAVTAQTVAVSPGGIGTYEAASVAAYASLGHDSGAALTAAITAHALKTAYSLVAGGIAVFVPRPGLLGRVRLPRVAVPVVELHAERAIPRPETPGKGGGPAPVVYFLPAYNEEATVGSVVRRMPATIDGHPVRAIVIDDGSTDGTAAAARLAGAEVIRFATNRGLGAGVREGLSLGADLGAAAVVFCDADGEYAPEELARLVGPILDGDADYVVGSRFAGEIRSMRPHRRIGNLVLTRMLRFVARTPITDGQSGYRALSLDAARAAEVVHDFNYAQVLTLDLLAKGFRYHEVPITYGFRTEGESFVRLGRYLRHVIPAVYAEVNTDPR